MQERGLLKKDLPVFHVAKNLYLIKASNLPIHVSKSLLAHKDLYRGALGVFHLTQFWCLMIFHTASENHWRHRHDQTRDLSGQIIFFSKLFPPPPYKTLYGQPQDKNISKHCLFTFGVWTACLRHSSMYLHYTKVQSSTSAIYISF